MPTVSVPDDIWSSFSKDQLAQRSQSMLDGLTSKLTDALTPPAPGGAAGTAATLAPSTGLPSLDALMSPFASAAKQMGAAAVSGQMPDGSSPGPDDSSPPYTPTASAPASSGLPSFQSLPSLGSLVASALPSAASTPPSTAPSRQPALTTGPTPSAAPLTIDHSSPQAFLGGLSTAATAALQRHNLPASLAPILAAIPMNEQGWQKDAPGNNYFGIKGSNPRTGANTGPVGTWEDYGSGRQNIQDTFRAYNDPSESVDDFLSFLESNPRYSKALDLARQTGDPASFIRAVHQAGYATDPAWSDKILSIAKTVPQTPAARQPALTAGPPPTPGEPGGPPLATTYRPLPTAASPGPPANAAASSATGGLDADGIVKAYSGTSYTYGGPGGRTAGFGAPTDCSGFVSAIYQNQYGLNLIPHTDGAYNQLKQLGAPEVKTADARPGDVVFYMGAGTGGAITHHMGVYAGDGKVLDDSVSGQDGVHVRDVGHAGQYVILRDPRLNAQTPTSASAPPPIQPSGLAEQTGGARVNQQQLAQAATSQPGVAPWQQAPPAVTPPSAPPDPPPTSPDSASVPQPMQMLRQPLSMTTMSQDSTPTWQDDQTQGGYVQPDMAPGPPIPDMSGTAAQAPDAPWRPPDATSSPLKPVYDLAGTVTGYVHTGVGALSSAATAAVTAPSPSPGQPAPFAPPDQRATGYGQDVSNLGAAVGQAAQESGLTDGRIGQSILDYVDQARAETDRQTKRQQEILQQAADWEDQNGTPDRTFGLRAVFDPAWRAANPDLADEYDVLNRALVIGAGQSSNPLEAAKAAEPAMQAARPAITRGIEAVRSGIGRVGQALDENAARVAGLDAERARQASVAAPGIFGAVPYESGTAGVAREASQPRFVPPEVRAQLTPNVEIPDDPRLAAAVQAVGGRITPDGIEVHVTRAQGEAAAGGVATRDGVFMEAVPEGGQSNFTRAKDDPNAVGGSQVLPATKTVFRKPLVIDDAPGSSGGFNQATETLGIRSPENDAEIAMTQQKIAQVRRDAEFNRQYGAPGVAAAHDAEVARLEQRLADLQASSGEARPITSDELDNAIKIAQNVGQHGSAQRAQALKDLVSRYGGNPNVIDDLLKIRSDTQAESAWAIKENIVAANARRQGYDGVFTVKDQEPNWADISKHPSMQPFTQATADAQAKLDAADQAIQRFGVRWYNSPESKTINIAASPEYKALAQESHAARQAFNQARDAMLAQGQKVKGEIPSAKISEIFDVQQGRNPTPGAHTPEFAGPIRDARIRLNQAYRESYKFPEGSPEEKAARAKAETILAELRGIEEKAATGAPGYTIHPDLVRPTAEPASTTAAGMAGVTPVPVRGEGDRLARINAMLSQGAASAISGGVGAATADQLGDPNDPNRRLKGFVAGAAVPFLAARGARALARAAGREIPQAEGALASFGTSPHYKPPSASKVAAEADRGAVRGERLNRDVNAPPSSVPWRHRLATAATDPSAALRYAEDLLSETAGTPRMRESDPLRPSTQARVNAGSVAHERIQADLEPAVVNAAQHGLHSELPQHLEDMHQKDILDEFYNRGYSESMATSQERIAKAQANNRPADIIQALADKAQQDAEQAGLRKMRTRQGKNPDMSYEEIDARLKGQEQRLKASGQWDALQQSAQQVWDHNAETRQRLVDAGELDPDKAAYLAQAYPHYVPTVPISHLDARGGGVVASGGAPTVSRGSQPAVRALEDVGTSGERLNPIVGSRNSTVLAERAIQRNNVASSFAQMMDDALHASPGTMGTTGEHRTFLGGGTDITFQRNGKPQTISVPKSVADGLQAASAMSADPGTVGRIWKQVMGTVTSAMTAGRASFLPVNVTRDMLDYAQRTATLEGGPQRLPGVMGTWLDEASKAASDIARAQVTGRGAAGAAIGAASGAAVGDENTTVSDRLRHAAEGGVAGAFLLGANRVRPTGDAAEFLARGGGSGGLSGHFGAGQRWYRDVARTGGAPIRSAADAAHYLGDWAKDVASLQGIKGINERAELISRTAAMRRGESVRGLGPTESMIAGRDASYDPDRAGVVARAVNGIVPFFNASVQNAAQTVRLFRDNPAAATATMVATVAPVMLAAEAWNRSDPQRAAVYDDVPQYLKDTGLVVVTPWAGSDARGDRPNYIWIPTGVQTPMVAGMRRAMQDVVDLPGLEPSSGTVGSGPDASSVEKWGNVLNTAVSMFSPIRGDTASSALSNLVPQGVKQGLEVANNRDFYRGTPIVSGPADERASALSQGVAGAANAAGRTFGNDFLQEVHPSQVEHLLGALPAYSDIASGASDLAAPGGYKQAEDRPVANEPFLGGIASRFVRDTGGANLTRAQDEHLPDVIRPALEQAGMRPSDVQTVPSSYKGAPLTRDEQERWQSATNALLPREVLAATRSSEWRAPNADKEQLLRDAMAKARSDAAARAMPRVDDREVERRKRIDAARKAG